MKLQSYHLVWLETHPHRTEEWLRERLKDGFDVHHCDGNHINDDPANLVLVECTDHWMLHSGGRSLGRLIRRPKKLRRALLEPVIVEPVVEKISKREKQRLMGKYYYEQMKEKLEQDALV